MAESNQNITQILELKVQGKDTLATIAQLNKELEEQKKTISDLKAEQKEHGKLTDEQAKEMELASATAQQLNKELRQQKAVLRENVAEIRSTDGSLKNLRAQYNQLKTEYEGMDEIQRKSLIPQMKDLKDRIEEADRAVGNYSTSVGNYEGAITRALPGFGKFQKTIQGLGIDATASAKIMAQNVVQALKSVGNSMKALMANPLIAGIAGILAIIMAIKKSINENQQAMDALQKIFAPFKTIVDALFKTLGEIIGKIAEGIAKVIGFFAQFNEFASAAIEAQTTLNELRENEIENIEGTAKSRLKLAELNDKIARKDLYDAEQRKQFAKEYRDEVMLQAQGDKERADLRRKAFELENKLAIEQNTLTRAQREEWAKLKAAQDHAIASGIELSKRASSQYATSVKEIEGETLAVKKAEQEKRKQYAETARRRKELEQTLNQQLEDLANELISSEQIREIAELETKAQRQRDALILRLETEKDLTEASKKNINDIILLLDDKLNKDIEAIQKKYADKVLEAEKAEEEKKDAEQNKRDAIRLQLRADKAALELEQRKIELDNIHQAEIEAFEKSHAELLALDDEQKLNLYSSLDAYELAVLKSNQRIEEANKSLYNSEIEKAQSLLQGVSSVAGNLSNIFGQLAGESKAMQGFQKALGIAQITADMAIGIAGAIKAGAGVPFPANIPAIASGVATVTAGIASAISTIKGTKDVQIPAILGSSAVSQQIQTPTISIPTPAAPTYTTTVLNLGGASQAQIGSTSQTQDISQAIKEAYKEIPAPVVKVSDIQSVGVQNENIKNVSVI